MTQVYKPFWGKPGCIIIKCEDRPIESGPAKGVATWVTYLDPKGKIRTGMKWVVWND